METIYLAHRLRPCIVRFVILVAREVGELQTHPMIRVVASDYALVMFTLIFHSWQPNDSFGTYHHNRKVTVEEIDEFLLIVMTPKLRLWHGMS
jgi:hypothetical protein